MHAKPTLTFTKQVNTKTNVMKWHSIDKIINTIGRKRNLLVLLQLKEYKKLRNKEIAKNLGGISPSTLSSILYQLRKEGLIIRKVYGEIPPLCVEYSLTKNGISLIIALDLMLNWIDRQDAITTKKDT